MKNQGNHGWHFGGGGGGMDWHKQHFYVSLHKHGARLQLHHSFHEPSHNCRCPAHNHAVLVSENGRNLLLNGAACVCTNENIRNPTIPKASPASLVDPLSVIHSCQ